MLDLLLLASILLFTVTGIAAVLYYKRIREVRQKYEEARDAVGNIVVSFNSQLQGYEEKLDDVSHRIEVISSENERAVNISKEHEKLLQTLMAKVNTYSGSEQKVPGQMRDMEKAMESLAATQETVVQRIAELEKLGQRIPPTPQAERAKIEAPIPIKREKALAPLTETELRVLKILADNSPKTAPEIREEINLTREHTARLMKKLYEEGYIERSVQKIPYTYRIKKEMLKVLRKQP